MRFRSNRIFPIESASMRSCGHCGKFSSRYPSDSETTEMGIHRTKEYEIMKPPVQHESGNSAA